jgi:hypothetical protein
MAGAIQGAAAVAVSMGLMERPAAANLNVKPERQVKLTPLSGEQLQELTCHQLLWVETVPHSCNL